MGHSDTKDTAATAGSVNGDQSRPASVGLDRARVLTAARTRQIRDFVERSGLAVARGALGDAEKALTYLERPEVVVGLRELDPLNPAHVRGLRRMVELLGAEGGICDAEELAAILRVEPGEIERRRNDG